MDPMGGEEQIDFEDEGFGGAQTKYQGGVAIHALADDELMGEDEEYDDLYSDVNVGKGFMQLHQSEVAAPPVREGNMGQAKKTEVPEQRAAAPVSQGLNLFGDSVDRKHSNVGEHTHDLKQGPMVSLGTGGVPVGYTDGTSVSQKVAVTDLGQDSQTRSLGFHGSTVPSKAGVFPSSLPGNVPNEPSHVLNTSSAGPQGVPHVPGNQMVVSANRPAVNENQIRPPSENGPTMLFVGELHWWTTDAELESVLSQYGRVKEIKFFDERASGKSKGYCQVEFYDSAAASACKAGMDGYVFNGRACVVAFASPQTLRQMGASYANKNQANNQAQSQGRRPMNDGAERGGNSNYQSGDTGRNYGRSGWGRGAHGVNRGPGGVGQIRGRGGGIGVKNMVGGAAGIGNNASGSGYGQGLPGPPFGGSGGLMHPQGMMGAGFDPTFMGRGVGYGGFSGPGFPGMLPSFPAVNAMGFGGIAPHVNPAFFGRGMGTNGMGILGSGGMEGYHSAMWNDVNAGGWGGEEHGRGTRESSYGGEDGASDYGYGESQDKGVRSTAGSRDKERGSDPDSRNPERRHRDNRELDWDRSEKEHREHRYPDEKDSYRDHRQRERGSGYGDDWDRGQSSSRSRSKSRAMAEEDYKPRSRDVDPGKRRRLPSE